MTFGYPGRTDRYLTSFGVDQAINITNPAIVKIRTKKLDVLKKKFPLLKILSRGTQIKLSGAPEQIEEAKEKIDLLVQYLQRNGHMS